MKKDNMQDDEIKNALLLEIAETNKYSDAVLIQRLTSDQEKENLITEAMNRALKEENLEKKISSTSPNRAKTPTKARSVFGKPITVQEPDWDVIAEYMDYTTSDIFALRNTDPEYVYKWPDINDKSTALNIRTRRYLPVLVSEEPDIITCGSVDKTGTYYRLNEHILVKLPKKIAENLDLAHDWECLNTEQQSYDQFVEQVEVQGQGGFTPIKEINKSSIAV